MTEQALRDRLDWLVAHIGPGKATADDVIDAFTPDFITHATAEALNGFLVGIDTLEVEEVELQGATLVARVKAAGQAARLMLAVEPEPPHRIAGLAVTEGPTLLEAIDAAPLIGAVPDVVVEALGPVADAMPGGGLAVGVLVNGDETVLALGDVASEAIFDIGSIAKPCTSILLATLVVDGVVALDDPVSKFLPAGTAVPDDDGRPITLVDLATHSAGLPRVPPNFDPADPQNPYADFTVEMLYAGLAETRLEFSIGSRPQYSNLGYGLLGHALGLAAGMPYRELIEERVFGPLGMSSTGVRSSTETDPGLATPYLASGEVGPWWDVGAILGAGGIRSTVSDLLRFARANLDPSSTPIGDALELAQQARIAEGERMGFGLGWVLLERLDGSNIVWHNGGTYGFHSFLAFHRPSGCAVVALANCGNSDHDAATLRVLSAAIEVAGSR